MIAVRPKGVNFFTLRRTHNEWTNCTGNPAGGAHEGPAVRQQEFSLRLVLYWGGRPRPLHGSGLSDGHRASHGAGLFPDRPELRNGPDGHLLPHTGPAETGKASRKLVAPRVIHSAYSHSRVRHTHGARGLYPRVGRACFYLGIRGL